MEHIILNAQQRSVTGKQVQQLRAKGLVPVVVYGKGFENQNLQIAANDFSSVYHTAGRSTLIDLRVEGHESPVKVLITDVVFDPMTQALMHADLYQVNMKEKVHATVSLKLVGVSKAVKELGGILLTQLTEVAIECLPSDLIHEIEVDISKLEEIGSTLSVRDLAVPATIHILNDADVIVVSVEHEAKQEEEAPAAEAAPAAAPAAGGAAPAAEAKQKN